MTEQMNKRQTGRGGARPGAGRKRSAQPSRVIGFRADEAAIAMFEAAAQSQSKTLSEFLRDAALAFASAAIQKASK